VRCFWLKVTSQRVGWKSHFDDVAGVENAPQNSQ
jgi:hypothetical protein